jgi:eukaryotic-like serine/threonine-protein kinase
VEALREGFGKYHVLEKLAQGGMADVYEVKTVGIAGFEKVQALKRILPRWAREPRFIRSFIDEARIAAELTHRNIVQVFDFGTRLLGDWCQSPRSITCRSRNRSVTCDFE